MQADYLIEGRRNMDIVIKVKEIKGRCPMYKVGDSFKLKGGYQLVSDIGVCMHALSSIMPYYNALRVSEPCRWGLAGKDDLSCAYVQCPDPADHTGGGTVIFEISKVDSSG